MKAILKYGQFTTMIELPQMQHTISIMKPNEMLSVMPMTEEELAEEISSPRGHRLDFRVEKRLTDDIWLYEFYGEN